MKTSSSVALPDSSVFSSRFSLPVVLIGCGLLGVWAGCSSGPDSHVVSAPPPPAPMTTTTSAPVMVAQPVPGSGTSTPLVVMQAPPTTPVVEAVVPQPSSRHVWIAGHWTWRNNRYEWMAGHWELPPRSDSVWIPPHWDREGDSYRFYEGYWN